MIDTTALPTGIFEDWIPQLWEYIRWFLGFNSVWVMLGFAACTAGLILTVIISIFYGKGSAQDDDDDFDYRYY